MRHGPATRPPGRSVMTRRALATTPGMLRPQTFSRNRSAGSGPTLGASATCTEMSGIGAGIGSAPTLGRRSPTRSERGAFVNLAWLLRSAYDPKTRLVAAPDLRDRIVHTALLKEIDPTY